MTDDVFGVGKTTSEVLGLLKEPVRALCGPAFEHLAGAWGDRVKHWREMRQIDLALDTVARLKDKGISPKAVAPSLLFPILETGSLVDDANLREKWINLLARAASQEETTIHPAFPTILAQLSPAEVQVLDVIFDSEGGEITGLHINIIHLEGIVGHHWAQMELFATNFVRLGVWRTTPAVLSTREIEEAFNRFSATSGKRKPKDSIELVHNDTVFEFTRLGTDFIMACRPL